MLVNVLDIHLHFGHHQIMEEYVVWICVPAPVSIYCGESDFNSISTSSDPPSTVFNTLHMGSKDQSDTKPWNLGAYLRMVLGNDLKETVIRPERLDQDAAGCCQFSGATGQTESSQERHSYRQSAFAIQCSAIPGWKSRSGATVGFVSYHVSNLQGRSGRSESWWSSKNTQNPKELGSSLCQPSRWMSWMLISCVCW